MPDATWRQPSLAAVEPGFPARRQEPHASQSPLEFPCGTKLPTPKPAGRMPLSLATKDGCRRGPPDLAAFALLRRGKPRKLAGHFMSTVPSDLKYAKSHEWIRVSGDTGTVGITDHAQHELTDIVFVELPAVGRQVKAGEASAVVESVKTASDIYAPVSGEITAVNSAVVDNPALVNTEPHAGGWLYQIKLSHPADLNALLSPADYQKQIDG